MPIWYSSPAMKLQDWMKEKGVRRSEAAEAVEVSVHTLGRYITGQRRPRRNVLERIKRLTGGSVTADDFYS